MLGHITCRCRYSGTRERARSWANLHLWLHKSRWTLEPGVRVKYRLDSDGRQAARILRYLVTFFELVHLCKMTERRPRGSAAETALSPTSFSENADPFRQRAIHRGRGPGGRPCCFRQTAGSVQPAHLSPWSQYYR